MTRAPAPTMLTIAALITALAAATTIESCGGFCSEAGCIPAVSVFVTNADGTPAAAFHGTIGEGANAVQITCQQCSDTVPAFIAADTTKLPDNAPITITSDENNETFTGSAMLQRREVQPNGEFCDPTCQLATVRVTLQAQ